jgi:hypothetical protein
MVFFLSQQISTNRHQTNNNIFLPLNQHQSSVTGQPNPWLTKLVGLLHFKNGHVNGQNLEFETKALT